MKFNVREKGVHCRDGAMATIEVVPFSPRFPCPKCGKESKVHRGDPGEVLKICSAHACRHVWDAKGVEAKPTAPHRFPCFHCAKETKVDREKGTRICPTCGQRYRDDLIPE